MYGCLANKRCILLLFERREFTKSFNNLTGGEVKLFCICEFPIYDHPVVSCPSHPAPIATSLLAYEGGPVRLTVSLENIFWLWDPLLLPKATRTWLEFIFELMSSLSWGQEGMWWGRVPLASLFLWTPQNLHITLWNR